MPFTIEQRSKIVKFYLETKSLVQTQREYRKHFGVKEAPSVTSIKKIVQKFEVHGTCHNRNKGNSGRRVSAENAEDNAENAVTVNQENYRHVIKKFTACLRGRRFDLKKLWFQQDGATPHTAVETRKLLSEKFEDRLISLKASHIWAPHSPDLSPLDFFLWGYAKDNVYKNKPTSISELKQEITTFMRAISADTCKAVIQNFAVRVRECLLRHGDHIEHVI